MGSATIRPGVAHASSAAPPWRQPGCDDRCRLLPMIEPGSRRHALKPLHDPEAHEAHGATLAGVADPLLVETGPLLLDLRRKSAHVFGQRIPLSGREWQLLALLGAARGGICSIREIIGAFWPMDEEVTTPAHHTIRVLVARLRARLGPAHTLVATEWIRGYYLQMEPPGAEVPPAPRRPWTQRYPACVGCGQTDHRHEGHGYCSPCRSLRATERRRALKGPQHDPRRDSAGRFIAAYHRD